MPVIAPPLSRQKIFCALYASRKPGVTKPGFLVSSPLPGSARSSVPESSQYTTSKIKRTPSPAFNPAPQDPLLRSPLTISRPFRIMTSDETMLNVSVGECKFMSHAFLTGERLSGMGHSAGWKPLFWNKGRFAATESRRRGRGAGRGIVPGRRLRNGALS